MLRRARDVVERRSSVPPALSCAPRELLRPRLCEVMDSANTAAPSATAVIGFTSGGRRDASWKATLSRKFCTAGPPTKTIRSTSCELRPARCSLGWLEWTPSMPDAIKSSYRPRLDGDVEVIFFTSLVTYTFSARLMTDSSLCDSAIFAFQQPTSCMVRSDLYCGWMPGLLASRSCPVAMASRRCGVRSNVPATHRNATVGKRFTRPPILSAMATSECRHQYRTQCRRSCVDA